MRSAASSLQRPGARASEAAPASARRRFLLLLIATLVSPAPARAGAALASFELTRSEEGLFLDYGVDFELPRGAEEALAKSVPLYFVAEAGVYRERWYWRDKRLARATRVWRIVYQPLTATYRVTFAGLSQSYETRDQAFAAMRRGVRWRIASDRRVGDAAGVYVEFSFRLDTSLLPRPMQIGIGGQPDWALAVEHLARLD